MALSDEFDGFLVDLDGVVWEGREFLPGAVEALRELLENGKKLVFVTNNPARSGADYAKRLAEAGVEVAGDSVLTAGVVTVELATEAAGPGGTAFVIGGEGLKDLVAAAGLKRLDGEEGNDADVVVLAGHRDFDYRELLTATRALRGGAALFATSRDPTMPMPGGYWPGTGAVLAAVETASGARAVIGGKPERALFERARSLMPESRRVAMVGDRLASDIEGGRRAGLATVLVLSGACSRAEGKSADPPPDHMIDDLSGLLR